MRTVDRRAVLAGVGVAASALAGCAGRFGSGADPDLVLADPDDYGLTYQRPTGNRRVDGRGSLPGDPVTVDLSTVPQWLVALPLAAGQGSLWVAVDDAETVAAVQVVDGATRRLSPQIPLGYAGGPPLVTVRDGRPAVVREPWDDGATDSHPVPVGEGLAYVARDGDLALWQGGERGRFAVDALPDARVVTDGERIAVLSGSTSRYPHGALGDRIEADTLTVVDVATARVEESLTLADGAVFEALAPVLAVDGDGRTEVATTVSDAAAGTRVVTVRDGEQVAAGPGFERGYRWRHLLAAAPFGPAGEPELGAVRTPHGRGVVEFYRRDGDALSVVASLAGYASHELGSRNLDGGLAADADGDGTVELVVPTAGRDALAGVVHGASGASEAWRAPLGASVSGNPAGAALPGGRLALGVATDDGRLHVWQ